MKHFVGITFMHYVHKTTLYYPLIRTLFWHSYKLVHNCLSHKNTVLYVVNLLFHVFFFL